MLQQSNTYNARGELVSSEDAAGNVTTHERFYYAPEGMWYDQVTLPDPDEPDPDPENPTTLPAPYTLSQSYLDGTPLWVVGTGTHPARSEESVEELNGYYHRVSTKFPGLAGTQWTKVYTNSLGQTVKLVYPDDAAELSAYDTLGRLAWQQDPDGVTTLFYSGEGEDDAAAQFGSLPMGLDWTGNWSLTVRDAATGTWGGVDFAGADRISRSRSMLADRDLGGSIHVVVRRSIAERWERFADSGPTVLSVTDTTLDGLRSWTEVHGRNSESLTVVDTSLGKRTTYLTAPNGVTSTSVSYYGRETSNSLELSGSVFGGATYTSYDPHGRVDSVTRVIDPNDGTTDAVTEMTYDELDRVETQTEPAPVASGDRRVTTFTYDNLGRTTVMSRGSGKDVFYTYEPTGEVRATWGFETNPVAMEYDDLGRLVLLKTYRTDGGTGPSSWSDPASTTWTYSEDRGFLKEKNYEGAAGPEYEYTAAGRLARRNWVREDGLKTTFQYNEFGDRILTDYDDDTPDVAIEYDRIGRPEVIYDGAGKRILAYDPDDGTLLSESITTDGTGDDLLAGVETTNTYNGLLQRTVHEAAINGHTINTVSYAYDADERLYRVTKGTMRASYTYVPHTGQVAGVGYELYAGSPAAWTAVASGSKSYDLLGRLTSTTWSDAVGSPPSTLESYAYLYDIDNRRTRMTLKDASYWDYQYDSLGQLTSGKRLLSGGTDYLPGSQFEYDFDALGNRTASRSGGKDDGTDLDDWTYTVNDLNQYTQRTVPGAIWMTGESSAPVVNVESTLADRIGPIYFAKLTYNNTVHPVHEEVTVQEVPGDSFTSLHFIPETPEVFTYDADGNLQSDGVWYYEWDAENRLKAMTMQPEIAAERLGDGQCWLRLEFAYDYMSRRISKRFLKTCDSPPKQIDDSAGSSFVWEHNAWTKYVYDLASGGGSWMLSASYQCDDEGDYVQQDQSFAWGPDLSSAYGGAGGIGGLAIYNDDYADSINSVDFGHMFPIYDGNGNVTRVYRIVSSGGNLVPHAAAQYEYGPFGELLGSQGDSDTRQPFRFSTKYTDAETGLLYYGYRYYSPSMGRWLSRDPAGELDSPNTQAFVNNSPPATTDPIGLWQYRSNQGWFGVQFGPSPRGKYASSFVLSFAADAFSFDACRDCDEITFAQVYSAYHNLWAEVDGLTWSPAPRVQWVVDHSIPYPDVDAGRASFAGPVQIATLQDSPQLDIFDYQRVFTNSFSLNYSMDFETCAMCEKGAARGDVYGCVTWSHFFSATAVWHDWTRTVDLGGSFVTWSSALSDQDLSYFTPKGRFVTTYVGAGTDLGGASSTLNIGMGPRGHPPRTAVMQAALTAHFFLPANP